MQSNWRKKSKAATKSKVEDFERNVRNPPCMPHVPLHYVNFDMRKKTTFCCDSSSHHHGFQAQHPNPHLRAAAANALSRIGRVGKT